MKRAEFDPSTYRSSGTYCSKPCGECAVANLVPPAYLEGAMTVDETLTEHTPDEIRAADPQTVQGWVYEASQFQGGFATNFPGEIDAVERSIDTIVSGNCSQHQLS